MTGIRLPDAVPLILALGLTLVSPGPAECQPPPATRAAASPDPEVCPLLTAADIEAVQKERPRDTQPSARVSGSFLMSQCLYLLPSFDKSVSVTLITRDPAQPGAQRPRQYWQQRFHRGGASQAGSSKGGEPAEDKESGPPQPVQGLADEAFWQGNRLTGALYVLRGDVILRISVGGGDDEATKLNKARELALKALPRFR